MSPINALSDRATALYVRLTTAQSDLSEDDRGLTTLEVAVIATALLAVAIAVAALITTAVGNHDSTIK
jgi:hypothetical protein